VSITISGLGHRYGELPVFTDLCLELPRKTVTCLLGPSGCGKTTLLNLLAGLLPLQEGTLTGIVPGSTGYIFQEPRLLPWRTVRANLDLILRSVFSADERRREVDRILEQMDLEEFGDYYPGQISGGMRQRVSLARAFAFPSDLLLMDEPFQALDPVFKLNLMADFLKVWKTDRRTCLLVTHNIQEAALLGDRILILSSRPARVLREIRNPVQESDRIPYSRLILELEHQLYTALASGSSEPVADEGNSPFRKFP